MLQGVEVRVFSWAKFQLNMKPKDLPFTIKNFSTRSPSYKDNILTIPSYYQNHDVNQFPQYLNRIRDATDIHLEICSGNGEWIAERAKNNPNTLYIAVEKKFMRVRKIWSKLVNNDIKNLIIVSGTGEDLFNFYLPKKSIDQIFINFPDPWPKKRHAKHRLIKKSFLPHLNTILKDSGIITIATDSNEYSQEIIEVFNDSGTFYNMYKDKGYTLLSAEYGGSYFNRLWQDLGRVNKLLQFRKKVIYKCV